MATIIETARIATAPDALWKDIGRFGSVGAWHPMLTKVESEGEHEGSLRMAEGKDGSLQIERLLEAIPERHLYRYRMESTPMTLRDYTSEFHIHDAPDGTSTVVWSAQFEPTSDDAATIEAVRDFLKAGLDNLQTLYGNGQHRWR